MYCKTSLQFGIRFYICSAEEDDGNGEDDDNDDDDDGDDSDDDDDDDDGDDPDTPTHQVCSGFTAWISFCFPTSCSKASTLSTEAILPFLC